MLKPLKTREGLLMLIWSVTIVGMWLIPTSKEFAIYEFVMARLLAFQCVWMLFEPEL
jgi:hypothetical protein